MNFNGKKEKSLKITFSKIACDKAFFKGCATEIKSVENLRLHVIEGPFRMWMTHARKFCGRETKDR